MIKKGLLLFVVCFFFGQVAFAADPKIKAIGLSHLSETTSQQLQTAFFFSADRPIRSVVINGKDQKN